jgi:hypothetical protein
MDDIKPRANKRRVVLQARTVGTASVRTNTAKIVRLRRVASLAGRSIFRLSGITKQTPIRRNYKSRLKHALVNFYRDQSAPTRLAYISLALIMVAAIVIEVSGPKKQLDRYSLRQIEGLLLEDPMPAYAEKLRTDPQSGTLKYNEGYVPGVDTSGESSGPKMTADFGGVQNEHKVTVNDPVNNVGITFKPRFKVDAPQKDQNRVVYPIKGKNASKVYTMKASGIKEDIILYKYIKDEIKFEYDVELATGLEMRSEQDGSLAVYGPEEPILGQVSTSNQKDADLLKKAQQKAEKTKLLFKIPAPFVIESNRDSSNAKAAYRLEGNKLTVHASNLKEAQYPLSIDPSVYVETASKLMRGNNETNLDFDVDNELIQKGKLTGGRFDTWTNTLAMPTNRLAHSSAVAGGYVYVAGGVDGTGAAQQTVYWSKFNTTTKALESPNPGNGACSNWCNSSVYNLPAGRYGHSMVAYNGFLYVIGGRDAGGAAVNTIYIAKLGANGEPSLWHPTDTNTANWTYWHTSSVSLSAAKSFGSAAAYNNRLYHVAGLGSDAQPVATVEYAQISPLGTISSWTTTGMVALPAARGQHSMQIYNDRVYVIGGNIANVSQNTVYYIKLATDGTMLGSWQTTTPFGTARVSNGGNFSTIWGGYIYISGGCTTQNGSGFCTAFAGDSQLASINADGSITDWTTISGVTNSRMGHSLVAWRNTLYTVGGCSAQNTTTGLCTTFLNVPQYGKINDDGDVSSVSDTVASGVGTCSGTNPYDCDMPPLGNNAGEGGRMSGGTIINNGFIYYIGGCTAAAQSSVCFTGNAGKAADTISYASIASDGTLVRVAAAACTTVGNAYYGSWCVDNTRTINGANGLAAFGYTVFNNVIYAVGGTDGTTWQSTVWRNSLNANGSIGTWATQSFATIGLGSARGYSYVFSRSNPNSSSMPGNLYVLGGCSGVTATDDGINCNGTIYPEVYKCNITSAGSIESGSGNQCTTTGQLQIDSEPGTGGTQGLGVMAGTVYANYVYLIGGQSPNQADRGSVMFAKIDNNNNIVDADGETATDNIWTTSASSISPARRRGVAFGYNGYIYALAGFASGSSLSDLMFAKIDVSTGDIGNFKVSQVTVNPRWDARAIVSNGYVYTFGGCSVGQPPADCTSITGSVQTFQLYNNYSGSPASYSASASQLFEDRYGLSAAVMNGYIYAVGGCKSSSDCNIPRKEVEYAQINPNGSIGSWQSSTLLPPSLVHMQLEAVGGTLYVIGGEDGGGSPYNTVYYSTMSGAAVSSWTAATHSLPAARSQMSATVWNDRIYVTGGKSDSAGTTTNTVYVSPSLSSGGNITSAWTSTTGFGTARSGHVAVAYANNLYILGGYTPSTYLNDTQFAKINSNGTVSGWTRGTSLPTRLRQADGFAANGFLYLFGGRSADTTCASNTIVAPISANTTIASGNNPTGIGEWFETNIKYTGDRYAASAVYSEGKAYIVGGACNGNLTGSNSVVQTTLQSQPQIAKYSRMIDTDTDVFPTKWLMNGLDNDIGARWKMRYRSSTAANAAWGQETNFGQITLGQPENYIPLNASGINTNFARYYYMSVSIDSSQAFGYPEDVSRGPTIADLTLFFTSDPNKRLRHGKTFTGGEQQPLDTPF